MTEVVISCAMFLFCNIISYVVYERTRRKIYLRIYMISCAFSLLIGIFILIIGIIKTLK